MDITFTLQSTSDGSLMTGQASNTTVYLSIDGGSFVTTTNSVSEIGMGAYKVTLTSTEAEFSTLLYAPVCSGAQSNILEIKADPVMPTVPTAAQNAAAVWGATTRTVTNTIPSASDNATAVWGATTRTVTNNIPTASDNATAVWSATARTLTASPTDISGLATSSALSVVATNVSAVKAKTDNLPSSPAAVGSAMTLTSAYDAAKTAAQAGSEMALTSAAVTAVQNGLATSSELTALETHGDSSWATATGFSTFNPSTDKVTLNTTEDGTLTAIKTKVDTLTNTDLTGIATSTDVSNAQTAIIARGNEAWTTATGFTVPADLANLATVGDISSLASYGDTKWLTATGFATPSDIPSASDNASAVWSANSRTLTESALTAADVWSYSSRTLTASALTAQQVWEYGTRTLTASPTDLTGIATSQDISDLQTHGDSNWNTATGFATPTNVSDAKADIISAIPTDYAKPGNAMTLTSSTIASVLAGVWNYENRSLTQEIVSQVTAEDIASISIAVWSYVPRKLTSIVSDVIEPNK